jgi:hypothetical protein
LLQSPSDAHGTAQAFSGPFTAQEASVSTQVAPGKSFVHAFASEHARVHAPHTHSKPPPQVVTQWSRKWVTLLDCAGLPSEHAPNIENGIAAEATHAVTCLNRILIRLSPHILLR